jgi:hypothetical protein
MLFWFLGLLWGFCGFSWFSFWVLLGCFVFGLCLGPMYTFCVLKGALRFFFFLIYTSLLIKKKRASTSN